MLKNRLLFQMKLEQRDDEEHQEVNGHALLRMVDKMNSIHRPLQKSEDQFDLPAIGIQQHHLKGGQIAPIGQQEELAAPHTEAH